MQQLREKVADWLQNHLSYNSSPARGTVSAALVILENISKELPNSWADLLSNKGGQIKGCSGRRVQKIIGRFGSHRKMYCKEGGRSNRGQRPAGERLFGALAVHLQSLSDQERTQVCRELQRFIYNRYILPWYKRQGLAVELRPASRASHWIAQILHAATEEGAAGIVAQHLIGAALALDFPNEFVPAHPVSAADASTAREGDFEINDAVFHVTVTPQESHLSKCKDNLECGLRPVILTFEDSIHAARRFARAKEIESNVEVYSIEQFVSHVIEERAKYESAQRLQRLSDLINEYNRRIDAAESNPGLRLPPFRRESPIRRAPT